MPDAFVFVIDTIDRSFLYKSTDYFASEDRIVRLDQNHGIDALLRKNGYYINRHDYNLVGLKNIGTNTCIGFCMPDHLSEGANVSFAKSIIEN